LLVNDMSEAFDHLTGVVTRLLGEGGCPWDREQTTESLKPFLIEECYEVLEAIDSGKSEPFCRELGDLLFQVLFHAEIARQSGRFDINAVLNASADKMIRRHPHVFNADSDGAPNGASLDSKAVLVKWEALKKAEPENRERKSALDGIPKALPALLRAHQIQSRAARVGFDWKEIGPVFDKIREEVEECEAALVQVEQSAAGGSDRRAADALEDEIGDLLFSVANVARHMKINSEDTLRRATDRFIRRFQKIESRAEKSGGLASLSPEAVDRLWEEAKEEEETER
jgi:tetrapyrrole methylase family protein/MazG family protein